MTLEHPEKHAIAPLDGISILVTFDDPDRSLEQKLVDHGANVKFAPLIEVVAAENVDQMLGDLDSFSTLVFFSKTAVRLFFAQLGRSNSAARSDDLCLGLSPGLSNRVWIAMGNGTRKELERQGIQSAQVPPNSDSHGLAQFLAAGKFPVPMLLLRANEGSSIVPDQLKTHQIEYRQAPLYALRQLGLEVETMAQATDGIFEWITVTSSTIARYAASELGEHLHRMKIASISPTTSAQIRELGYEVAVEANSYDYDGLVAAIVNHRTLQSD